MSQSLSSTIGLSLHLAWAVARRIKDSSVLTVTGMTLEPPAVEMASKSLYRVKKFYKMEGLPLSHIGPGFDQVIVSFVCKLWLDVELGICDVLLEELSCDKFLFSARVCKSIVSFESSELLLDSIDSCLQDTIGGGIVEEVQELVRSLDSMI